MSADLIMKLADADLTAQMEGAVAYILARSCLKEHVDPEELTTAAAALANDFFSALNRAVRENSR